MTEQLKQAAQSMSHDETHDWGDRIAKLQRPALTTSQPAQAGEVDERVEDSYGSTDIPWSFTVCRELEPQEKRLMSMLVSAFGSSHPAIDDMAHLILNRPASLPTPQQATPVQDVGASADYWGDLAQQKADADARRGVSMPVSYYTSSIVGALPATQQATPDVPETDFGNMVTQQATPEPVGEPDAWLRQAKQGPGVHDPLVILGAARPTGYVAAYRPVAYCDAHPAPGVPEDVQRNAARWEEVLRQVGADRQCGGFRFTLYNLRPIPGSNPMQGAVCQHFTQAVDAALAAAQANGADPEDLAAAGVMLMERRADHA